MTKYTAMSFFSLFSFQTLFQNSPHEVADDRTIVHFLKRAFKVKMLKACRGRARRQSPQAQWVMESGRNEGKAAFPATQGLAFHDKGFRFQSGVRSHWSALCKEISLSDLNLLKVNLVAVLTICAQANSIITSYPPSYIP